MPANRRGTSRNHFLNRKISISLQVRHDRILVERLYPQAEVVHVAARRSFAFDQIDHCRTDAEVRHAELRPIGHVLRAEHLAVELPHALDVAHPQYNVIDATNGQHGLRILPELGE